MRVQFNPTQQSIITLLSDGLFHTGTKLGQSIGISRSGIWKQINQLISLGVPIKSFPQLGYQMPHAFTALDTAKVRLVLEENNYYKPLDLHFLSVIDSTNLYLKELPKSTRLALCSAELQTQGRGRFGRNWHSPFGENLYCSIRWHWPSDLAKLAGLSLVVSLAIVATVNQVLPNELIQIKWPNDLLWQDKKLCGTLIEINAESNADAQVIIGIGLNVNSDTQNNPLLDNPWCSLYEMNKTILDRNTLLALLIIKLDEYITRFISNDLRLFMEEWQQYDYLFGREIRVFQSTETYFGTASGINSLGQLILITPQGEQLVMSSGDTSLKCALSSRVK